MLEHSCGPSMTRFAIKVEFDLSSLRMLFGMVLDANLVLSIRLVTNPLGAEEERASDANRMGKAWDVIGRVLEQRKFSHRQGGLYVGDISVDAVSCVLAAQELEQSFKWFSGVVRDIRMLRIEDDTDLKPAISSARP